MGLFAVLGLATAIGLFHLKAWTRYSTLVFAAFLVFVGLFSAPLFVLVPITPPPNTPAPGFEQIARVTKVVMAAFGIEIAALG